MTESQLQCIRCSAKMPAPQILSCQHEQVFEADRGSGYYLFDKGQIPSSRAERKKAAVWCIQGNKVYATCIFCGGVHDLSNHEITKGVVGQCATCVACGNHTFMILRNWDGGDREAVYVDGDESVDDLDRDRDDDDDS